YMVQSILSIEGESLQLDATDAIAVGLCHAHRDNAAGRSPQRDWSSFVRENPGRIKD
ncbi:MAG: crossover junction endodeoxyribonuclease RuvC, partial [Rhodothermales bacterium]|nr:crossover junction endodeoxyribonuclease RuvC [Rhodothermales bacterium]